jgi:hypothetical protein
MFGTFIIKINLIFPLTRKLVSFRFGFLISQLSLKEMDLIHGVYIAEPEP